jgi:cytochrome b pre-mRNA-processing protein 3
MQRVILRPSRPLLTYLNAYALRPYTSVQAPKPTPGPTKPYEHEKGPKREPSWLTRKLKQSPIALRAFLRVFGALGYGSKRQVAARRALGLYEQLCAERAEEDHRFWAEGARHFLLPPFFFSPWMTSLSLSGPIECHLPPTFQSWFTVTNLHVWMLTTRLRALPAPHAQAHIQGLIDHFFLDVEDRIRQVLRPQSQSVPRDSPVATPTPMPTPPRAASFYDPRSPRQPPGAATGVGKRRRAPEALVSKQMKIFREQYSGLGVALDLALARGSDAVLAAAMWRNLLGARGAQGFALSLAPTSPVPEYRRAVNPGGTMARMSDTARAREEKRDDGSGVHDFGPEERDAYVRFPETMLVLTAYVRGEVARLAAIPDEKIMGTGATLGREAEGVADLRFRKISSAKTLVDELLDRS